MMQTPEDAMPIFAPGTRIHDITVPFSEAVPTWPTHPASSVEPMTRIARGDRSNVSRVSISSHAGTHLDANWHFIDDGRRLLDIPLDRWCGPCWVAAIPDDVPVVGPDHLEAAGIPEGVERLLLRTRNSRDWAAWDGTTPLPFREDYVGVNPAGAQWLLDRGTRMIGIDYLSVGPYGPENKVTHTLLLGNDVLIVETLDLSRIAPGPYELICLPLKLAIGDGAPCRAILVEQAG
jgi:arylformamidase